MPVPSGQEASALQDVFKTFASDVALGCEVLAIVLLGFGALETAWILLGHPRQFGDLYFIKGLWMRFASRILLALELTLAADIVETAIAPTWNEIGQLAAIATIRTVLNLFLERDIEKSEAMARARDSEASAGAEAALSRSASAGPAPG
jgi:uncharacterized membrane protein